MINFTKIDTDREIINSDIIFDTKIVWFGLLFVLKFCQETSKKQP